MPTRTIVLDLSGHGTATADQLVVTLELPAQFKTFADLKAAMFSYSVFVTNHLRRLSPDSYARLADLSDDQRFVMAVLTGVRELAYIGHEQGRGQAITHRVPLTDAVWIERILARGGVQACARVCEAFLQMFSEG